MAFVTGLLLIDAPASALNNGQGEDTKAKVKSIYVRGQSFPYVSAQAFRYWLRDSLASNYPDWEASPVITAGAGKKQQAFTAGNPIMYWDDDLLGYMRAEKIETVTRTSPFRTSTLVSIAPAHLVDDFGVMARAKKEEGDKEGVLLHGHEFYRTTLKGLFSLDLGSTGTFTNQRRSGYQNLGEDTIRQAEELNLEYLQEQSAFRLPVDERIARVQVLLRSIARLSGGAKQTLHYTDVAPAFVIAAVTRGGNHVFGRVVQANNQGEPVIHEGALDQAIHVFENDLLSPIFVGRAEGFMDSEHTRLTDRNLRVTHPIQALDELATYLAENPALMD
jgi:CRISPR-associated protein Cst2